MLAVLSIEHRVAPAGPVLGDTTLDLPPVGVLLGIACADASRRCTGTETLCQHLSTRRRPHPSSRVVELAKLLYCTPWYEPCRNKPDGTCIPESATPQALMFGVWRPYGCGAGDKADSVGRRCSWDDSTRRQERSSVAVVREHVAGVVIANAGRNPEPIVLTGVAQHRAPVGAADDSTAGLGERRGEDETVHRRAVVAQRFLPALVGCRIEELRPHARRRSFHR